MLAGLAVDKEILPFCQYAVLIIAQSSRRPCHSGAETFGGRPSLPPEAITSCGLSQQGFRGSGNADWDRRYTRIALSIITGVNPFTVCIKGRAVAIAGYLPCVRTRNPYSCGN